MGRPDRRDGQPSGTVGRYLLPTGRSTGVDGTGRLMAGRARGQGGHAGRAGTRAGRARGQGGHAGRAGTRAGRARGASLAGSPNHRQRNVRRGCPFRLARHVTAGNVAPERSTARRLNSLPLIGAEPIAGGRWRLHAGVQHRFSVTSWNASLSTLALRSSTRNLAPHSSPHCGFPRGRVGR